MKKTIFWKEDVQNDFMKEGGKLYVPNAEVIIPNLQQITQYARKNEIPIMGSVDAHEPDDPEFELYPPHCIKGTPGQLIIDEIRPDIAMKFVENREYREEELEKLAAYDGDLYFEKQTTKVFDNPNTEKVLEMVKPELIVVYGVVDHICVQEAVVGMRDRGYNVAVVSDATKELDAGAREAAFELFREKGATVVTTEGIIKYLKGVEKHGA
ncbi:MAG: cysteine hydrolase [Nanoarchaeota archaeon]|nr:cysteine hydrolase [Nanoarchaeota archaeon]